MSWVCKGGHENSDENFNCPICLDINPEATPEEVAEYWEEQGGKPES